MSYIKIKYDVCHYIDDEPVYVDRFIRIKYNKNKKDKTVSIKMTEEALLDIIQIAKDRGLNITIEE